MSSLNEIHSVGHQCHFHCRSSYLLYLTLTDDVAAAVLLSDTAAVAIELISDVVVTADGAAGTSVAKSACTFGCLRKFRKFSIATAHRGFSLSSAPFVSKDTFFFSISLEAASML